MLILISVLHKFLSAQGSSLSSRQSSQTAQREFFTARYVCKGYYFTISDLTVDTVKEGASTRQATSPRTSHCLPDAKIRHLRGRVTAYDTHTKI